MPNENGSWILYGVDEDDPECIHTAEELVEYVEKIGFLPLFKNDIPGFSVEERTVSRYWWSDDPVRDPWLWREVISRGDRVAYGKFFDKKAGFISKEWMPVFANYRRDGYDFDALWDDEKAPIRQKKIMDLFEDDDTELMSVEIKEKAGFDKGGEKGFDSTMTALQMETYLCIRDFRHKKNKQGQEYGMAVAVYSKPEKIWGYEYVTSQYSTDPVQSGMQIVNHMIEEYGIAGAAQIKKLLGLRPGQAPERQVKEKVIDYPANLMAELGMPLEKDSDHKTQETAKDRTVGLEFVLGKIKDKYAEIVRLRYEKGMTFKKISEVVGISAGRCGELCKRALSQMKSPENSAWIKEGYKGHMADKLRRVEQIKAQFIDQGKEKEALLLDKTPDSLKGISANQADMLHKAGIFTLGLLLLAMEKENWNWQVAGIGHVTKTNIEAAMEKAGLLGKE